MGLLIPGAPHRCKRRVRIRFFEELEKSLGEQIRMLRTGSAFLAVAAFLLPVKVGPSRLARAPALPAIAVEARRGEHGATVRPVR
jgi:hypothetical protein